jgi:hypothetical protein
MYIVYVCIIYATQGEAQAAKVKKTCQLPEDGQELKSKHVGAVINRLNTV